MSQALTVFLPYVLPEVPECSEPLALQRILAACIEFCDKSHYWEYLIENVDLVLNTPTYTLTLPAGSQFVTIIDPIYYNGVKIWHKTKEWLDNYVLNWETAQGMTPEYYTMPAEGVIQPYPYPDASLVAGIEKIKVILKPLPTATTVEDFLFNEFYEAIAAGAKSKLMEMPNVKWSNAQLSVYYKAQFDDAISKAKSKVKSGFKTEHRYARNRAHYF